MEIEEERREKTEEVYAMDYSKERNMIISGGGDDAISFYTLDGGEYLLDEVIEGLEDSVIFVSFVERNKAVGVAMDGGVVYIDLFEERGRVNKKIEAIEYQMDISNVCMDEKKKYLYLAAKDGVIERIPSTLVQEHQRSNNLLYQGHGSDILAMEQIGDLLYTASYKEVIIFQVTSASIISQYKIKDEELTSMKVHPNGRIFAVGTISSILILLSFSVTRGISEIHRESAEEGPIECIQYIGDTLIYSGFMKKIHILDVPHKTKRTTEIPEKDSCILSIHPVSETVSLAICNIGLVYLIDTRGNNKIVKEYQIDDMILSSIHFGKYLALGTTAGVHFLDLSK